MAKIIPLSGFKGMPFTVGTVIKSGLGEETLRVYPYWPYHRLNVWPNDPFWSKAKTGLSAHITTLPPLPEETLSAQKAK
jgi:hypothetical protein